jgi:hypothetical protein
MKKPFSYPVLALILLTIFACAIPTSVEITGSPTVKFAINDMEFGDSFITMMGGALNFSEISLFNCPENPDDYLTYLIYREFLNEPFELEVDLGIKFEEITAIMDDIELKIGGYTIDVKYIPPALGGDKNVIVLENEEILYNNKAAPVKLPFSELGDFLDGFSFDNVKSKIYFSGSPLLSVLSIDIYLTDDDGEPIRVDPIFHKKGIEDPKPSGLNDIVAAIIDPTEIIEYTEPDLPANGDPFLINEFLNSSDNVNLVYNIYLEEGQKIDIDWIGDKFNLLVEMLVWVPLQFKAVTNPAKFSLPEVFGDIGVALKSLSEYDDVIQSVSLSFEIAPRNPFGSAILVITSDGIINGIHSPFTQNSMVFSISKDDMEAIKEEDPFNPQFTLYFPLGSEFSIPKTEMAIKYVSLNATFTIEMDL